MGESVDRSAREPARVKAMWAELDAWLAATKAPIPTKANPEFDNSH